MTNSERVDRLPCDGTAGDKKRIGGGTQTGGRPVGSRTDESTETGRKGQPAPSGAAPLPDRRGQSFLNCCWS
jgi:hypothetical protein